jgi:hypothetical protein
MKLFNEQIERGQQLSDIVKKVFKDFPNKPKGSTLIHYVSPKYSKTSSFEVYSGFKVYLHFFSEKTYIALHDYGSPDDMEVFRSDFVPLAKALEEAIKVFNNKQSSEAGK